MSDHIVIVLHPKQNVNEAYRHLQAILPGARLEPQFRGLPPEDSNEGAVLSEMRRMMRFVCPSDVDINALVQKIQVDPLVEEVYHERPAEPA
jgi:hypothetical protein